MSPYRTPPPPADPTREDRGSFESVAMGLLWLCVGAIPVTLAIVHRSPFGWEPSLGLLLAGFGAWCLALEAAAIRRARRARRRLTLKELRTWTRSS